MAIRNLEDLSSDDLDRVVHTLWIMELGEATEATLVHYTSFNYPDDRTSTARAELERRRALEE